MNAAAYIFWACFLLILYTYVLYPVVLFLAYSLLQARLDWRYLNSRRDRRAGHLAGQAVLSVSIIIPVYNEEHRLEEKIANLRALDYPPEKFEVVFVSDGSDDGTNRILSALEDPRIRVVVLRDRGGKSAALNAGVVESTGQVLVFSDAATLMEPDAPRMLARHFSDPTVGVVCGALRFTASEESARTEGVYWKYECVLRLMEARLGATLTASGAIYALRRDCYVNLSPQTLIDDLVVPMNARRLGYRVLYDPEAVATDFAAESISGEFARRVRIAVGSFRALPQLLRVPMRGFTPTAFLSHKLLRWILPFLLLGLLLSNVFLLDRRTYFLAFCGQLCFYAWAILGGLLRRRLGNIRFALIGYFLVAMNAAFLVGFFRSLTSRKETTWQRVS